MARSRERNRKSVLVLALFLAAWMGMAGCGGGARPRAGTVVVLIESGPTNLDPRIGTDAQSEYLDGLIFDSLVKRDEHGNVGPELATSWERPDPTTYIFHLRAGVRFQNGRRLTSADVKYTFESMLDGEVQTAKRGSFSIIERIETRDPLTVVFKLRQPYESFLEDLVSPGIGIVPRPGAAGGAADPAEHPIGTGPFRFVRQEEGEEVVLERNASYWGAAPKIERAIFRIVPDATTRALELRKGSADIAVNALTPDMTAALGKTAGIRVSDEPGTAVEYIAFNCADPLLRDRRVRQALAYATNRAEIVHYLLRDEARPANSLLPPGNWAYEASVAGYNFDPERANRLLDAAGFRRGKDGIRFRLTMKTSTEEASRLLGAVLQQQWGQVGVELELHSLEFGTFYADITRGSFELYALRWIGANDDPDIFYYVFDSAEIPPAGANRGRYRNGELDRLLERARVEPDREKRRELYGEAQRIVARDEPYLLLWYRDNVAVHRERIENVKIEPAGGFEFLTSALLSGE